VNNVVVMRQCTNPLAYEFATQLQLSNYQNTMFFTQRNIEYCQRELGRVGIMAEQIVRQVLAFYEIRTVFVSDTRIMVVLKTGKQWQTLPDQIMRIVEKALDEYGELHE